MEEMSLHKAAAGQFKSIIQNMSIAVNFGICFSCSTLFLINCFSLDYLLDLSILDPFPRSPFKGTDESRSLNFDQRDRTRYNCRTPFILPSQQLNLTNFLASRSLLEPPHLSRGAASGLSWKDRQPGTRIFHHILQFFFNELVRFCPLQKQNLF